MRRAYLHRVVNGQGRIEREYAIGMGRIDLCLFYGDAMIGMELKVWRDDEKYPLNAELEQLDNYFGGLSLNSGWLIIFDRRSDLPRISETGEDRACHHTSWSGYHRDSCIT